MSMWLLVSRAGGAVLPGGLSWLGALVPVPTSSPWCLFSTLLEASADALLSEIFEQLQLFLKGGPAAQG